MSNIISIVEGDGEVNALPVLLRRLPEFCDTPHLYTEVLRPIRVYKDRFLNRNEEFRRHLLFAADKCGNDGWILILLDADEGCPATLGANILTRASAIVPHRRVSVVLPNREFEAWFIAAAYSLNGCRGFQFNDEQLIPAEEKRNAKGWIKERMAGGSYGEVTDQPALAAAMDLHQVFERSRSFRKLCSEWQKHVAGRPS